MSSVVAGSIPEGALSWMPALGEEITPELRRGVGGGNIAAPRGDRFRNVSGEGRILIVVTFALHYLKFELGSFIRPSGFRFQLATRYAEGVRWQTAGGSIRQSNTTQQSA